MQGLFDIFKKKMKGKGLYLPFYLFTFILLIACAKMGSPDGGWYDDDPPKVIKAEPAEQSINVKTKKVSIYFDEFIKLEDATNKVIISPPQLDDIRMSSLL